MSRQQDNQEDDSHPPTPVSAESNLEADRIKAELVGQGPGTDPFSAAVRATRMPMIVTNPRLPDNPVIFANDAFCRLTGYRHDEIIGRNCRFLQGKDTSQAVRASIREAVRQGRALETDVLNYRKDGRTFWNRLLMAPVHDAEGKVAYFFASQVDVTIERERLEGLESDNAALMAEVAGRLHAQQESEARLRFATDAGRLGIWEYSPSSGVLTTSGWFKANFGLPLDASIDWAQVEAAIHSHDRARRQDALAHSMATGAPYDMEYRVIWPDGTIHWLHAVAQVEHAAGKPLRIAGISMDVTERREAEMRLELSEQTMRLATEAAEIGTWDLDVTTRSLVLSGRTRAMLGLTTPGPCSLADLTTRVHPADRNAALASLAPVLDSRQRAIYDVTCRTVGHADGAVRWIALKGKGVFDAGGQCVRAIGTAIDITERRSQSLRQEFLLELADTVRGLGDSSEIMMAAAGALGRHLHVSRVGFGLVDTGEDALRLETGYSDGAEPLHGVYPTSIFGQDNVKHLQAGQTVVCSDTATASAEEQSAWSIRAIRSFVSIPFLRSGRFKASMFVTCRTPRSWEREEIALVEEVAARTWDAVERARAERELRNANESLELQVTERTQTLRANEARLRTVFETSYQLQGLMSPDGVLLDANTASLEAVQMRLEDVVGKPLWKTAWFAQTPGMAETVRQGVAAAARGQAVRQEITVNLPGGARSYDFSMRPVKDATGAVVAIVPEAMDLTERRMAEEALRQAQKIEAVGQLTGGIAHDFNNLLGGIMGSLELIERRLAAGRLDGLERYTANAMTSAQRAAALTQRLLAFARRQPLDPKPVNANALIEGMQELLKRTLGPAIPLDMTLRNGLWPVLCDANQLESALLNLAINARDAMPGGGRLEVDTANAVLDEAACRSYGGELAPGAYVTITVTDTGSGIPADIIGKVFDPFFTTKPLGQGTGLGLSMLYGFVRQSGGHVRVASQPGQGTTFVLYLPRLAPRDDGQPDNADTAGSGVLPAARGETILVVDDEPSLRMLIAETLRELGYPILEAGDGPEALRVLQSGVHVDLLLTDVGLPGLNGRQVADAARLGRPGLKVLFVTGYAHMADMGGGAEILEPGMELIAKPFGLDVLAARVATMLGRETAPGPGGPQLGGPSPPVAAD